MHTRERPQQPPAPPEPHPHAWVVESQHPTSDGYVVYVRCITCGRRRVDVQPDEYAAARPLTREIGAIRSAGST
ncbi:hypothetical protein CLV56_1120 [Mumia flava]|uniref:Uncharacterized protein n=1 Tax=Mumia flava TaxID=1348852 RepID=A0A0B2BM72_9ACTN|nr:hypothetical protein [Mumia flava]PJJ56905.1 hypothetical protein CLV56_1120 [Mumia flava]